VIVVSKKIALTGAEAVGTAIKQLNPDVVAAFPITPQTEIMHQFAKFVADGDVDTELITVESEHSAMSAAVGASAAGSRVMTATSSAGLALMFEIVYIAASTRLPIVMPVVNRALSAPINIHCDHSDSMACRDSGWIQLYSENAQEAYENTLMAMKIAEHKDVRLPVMVCLDGFITSHGVEGVTIYEDKKVKKFVGEHFAIRPLLDVEKPTTYGPLDLQDYYFEHKRQQIEGMKNAKKIILEVSKEFSKTFGAKKYGFIEEYKLKDADFVIVVLNSSAGTTKVVVDELRAKGVKAGLLKIRMFRPFPAEEIKKALSKAKAVAVLDRSDSFGAEGGPVYLEVKSALKDSKVKIVDYIYGLGGRDLTLGLIHSVYKDLKEDKLKPITYLGVRE